MCQACCGLRGWGTSAWVLCGRCSAWSGQQWHPMLGAAGRIKNGSGAVAAAAGTRCAAMPLSFPLEHAQLDEVESWGAYLANPAGTGPVRLSTSIHSSFSLGVVSRPKAGRVPVSCTHPARSVCSSSSGSCLTRMPVTAHAFGLNFGHQIHSIGASSMHCRCQEPSC